MRTQLVIDDQLMAETLAATGLSSRREVVELALRTLLRLKRQGEIKRLKGQIEWDGDLDAMRRNRGAESDVAHSTEAGSAS